MALTNSSVKRSVDAIGDDILTFQTSGSKQVQAVASVDDSGAQIVGYGACNVAVAGAITYVGKESAAGAWLVMSIDATSGTVIRYATVANNVAVLTYAAAWAARATLTYGTYSEAF